MFSVNDYLALYNRILKPLAQPVDILLNNGTDFDAPVTVEAHVSSLKEHDLVQGGPTRIGDLKLIILYSDLPAGMRRLGKQDRITISSKNYGVILWDTDSRSIGDQTIAVEATVRG